MQNENSSKVLHIPGCVDYYIIPENYAVVERSTGRVISTGNKAKIKISLYGLPEREVYVQWLCYLSKFGGIIHRDYVDIIFDYTFVPVYTLSGKVTELKQPVFRTPRYYPGKDLRFVPGFGNTVVSSKGEFYTITNEGHLQRKMTYKLANNPYPLIHIAKGVNKLVHRLVALTWCPKPEDGRYIIVDHIDGNKLNFDSSNLRWTDHKGNMGATLVQGVKGDNFMIIVRNIDTGHEDTYPSLTTACLAINRSRINTGVTPLGPGKVFTTRSGRYEIKMAIDDRPWVYVNGNLPKSDNLKRDISKLFNGKVPKQIRVTGPSIGTKIFTSFVNLFHDFLKCDLTVENIKNLHEILNNKYPGCSVNFDSEGQYEAKNYQTGKIVTGKNLKEIADKAGISKSSAIKFCRRGELFNGWLIRPVDNECETPWPNITETMPTNAPIGFEVQKYSEFTGECYGEIKSFQSLRKMCEEMGWNRSNIRTHMTDEKGDLCGKVYMGYMVKPIGKERLDLSENNVRNSVSNIDITSLNAHVTSNGY